MKILIPLLSLSFLALSPFPAQADDSQWVCTAVGQISGGRRPVPTRGVGYGPDQETAAANALFECGGAAFDCQVVSCDQTQ